MLCTFEFWVLFSVLIVGQGMGLAWINNDRQMLQAYAESADIKTLTYPAMISCFNSFGRLFYGSMSEFLLPKMSRVWFLLLSFALLALAYWSVFLFGSVMMWPAGAVVGVAYGGLWGVQPVIISEVFGPKQYGLKYALSAIAAYAGSEIFSHYLAGSFYDQEARILGDGNTCLKPSCYNRFLAIAGTCGIVAFVVGFGLNIMTRNTYKQIRDRLNGVVEE